MRLSRHQNNGERAERAAGFAEHVETPEMQWKSIGRGDQTPTHERGFALAAVRLSDGQNLLSGRDIIARLEEQQILDVECVGNRRKIGAKNKASAHAAKC